MSNLRILIPILFVSTVGLVAGWTAGNISRFGAKTAKKPATAAYSGRVVDARGTPISAASIHAFWIGKSAVPTLVGRTGTGDDGAYRLELETRPDGEGALLLRADAPGHASDGRAVALDDEQQDFALLREAMAIEVHVTGAEGGDVEAAEVAVSFEPIAGRAGTVLVATGKSDARGRFILEAVPTIAGTVHYSAIARGSGRAFGSLKKSPGDAVLKISARLEAGVLFGGVVVDANGTAIAGADLEVEEANGPWSASAGSDENGAFLISDAPKNADLLLAVGGDYVLADGNDTLAIRDATTELRVIVEFAGKISGRVVTPEGRPIAGARISALPSDRTLGAPRAVTSDRDGRFELRGLRRSTLWELEARDISHAPSFLENVSTNQTVELVMRRGGAIEGTVSDSTGDSYQDIEIYAHHTALEGDRVIGLKDYSETKTGPDGKYRLDRLSEGEWRVEIRSRVRMQWSPIATQVLNAAVRDGETTVLEEVALPRGGKLAGKLVDGSGAIAVMILPDDRGGAPHTLRVRTAADGSFSLADLAPGAYAVHVRHEALGFASASGVQIKASETTALELRFTGDRQLAGVLVDSAGRAVAGAVIEIFDPGAGSQNAHRLPGRAPDNFSGSAAKTGADGSFVVSGLEARTYRLRAVKEDQPPLELDVEAGRSTPLALVLPKPAELSVYLHQEGAVMSARPVLLESGSGGTTSYALTDETGAARFAALSPGTYRVRAASPGLPERTVELEAGSTLSIDLSAHE